MAIRLTLRARWYHEAWLWHVEHLRVTSSDVLRVGESARYPALQRLLFNGWVKAEWGTSENFTTPRRMTWNNGR